ncbi:MAG: EAL domain-containing protein [Lachnospiraceae bacterium]|nr:EAL domain-containing protein [Lachnospiraceae bacterium]
MLIATIMSVFALTPLTVCADEPSKNVRVGWYESPFNSMDESGRRSGYAYEYQMKIAAYTGWDYSYVSGSWPDLMQMLVDGKIDILSDVSYTEERAKDMLFTDLPMGTEEYCIFITPKNQEISFDDLSSLNGKRIGVNKGSLQAGFYSSWAKEHNINAELVELSCNEGTAVDMLEHGKLDAYITLNAYGDPKRLVPLCKIGSSDFFFAVNKDRPDLLGELNMAMSRIEDEDPYFNLKMFEKHIKRFGTNAFLSPEESSWLASHGKIRVGYQDGYMAFCAMDPETGELRGALKDYLEYASDCIEGAHIDFEAVAFPTAQAALEALDRDEVDCVFPANLSDYDGEKMHLEMTPALMRTEIFAVIRQSDRETFANREHVVVAVNEGNPNYDAFLRENYPDWRTVYYPTTADCLKAVSNNVADCVLISSYRYNNISRMCERYRLTTYVTGIALDYCFAVRNGEIPLYSILAKIVGIVPTSTFDAALSHYLTEDARRSLPDVLYDNIGTVTAVTGAVVVLILFLLFRSMKSEKKAQKLISATEIDELTGLYNRDYFFQYAYRMFLDRRDIPRDAVVLNIEQFHSINALNGWDFGDKILRALAAEVRQVASEGAGIAGRFGADRFDIYFRSTDDYQAIFDRLQRRLRNVAPEASVRLRMGVMPWQEDLEPIQQFDMARTACNMARGHYVEHLIVFDEKVRKRELNDQLLENDLQRALDGFEFEVFYQPKYDIQAEPPQLVGAEALIRWRHPKLGMVAPDSFIPLFEKNGKIGDIDKYVWSHTARQIARWKTEFGKTLPVSVNLSRVDVFDPKLEETLDEILIENGLEHDTLKLEITESAYTGNSDKVINVAEALHRKGYTIEMDDFGTGYSSLNMLSAMPIDVLKMDRMFVQNIGNNDKDNQMVALILGIAKNMGIPVIAEGVETKEQILALKEMGCRYVQGYYFSRPLHPSDFEAKILREEKQ